MYELLRSRAWWPSMRQDCAKVVKECQICQRHKDSTQATPGLLQPLPIPQERFSSWSMDFITSLPLCNGYNAIFTCVDRLTKLTRLIPCSLGEGALTGE